MTLERHVVWTLQQLHFAVGDTWEQVRDELVSADKIIFSWLPNNQMQGNADKGQLITNHQNLEISISILGKSFKICIQ